MKIVKERTRIIFSEYSDIEKKKLEDLVATIDKVLFFEDIDDKTICVPPGMIDTIMKIFPKIEIEDKTSTYWPYSMIEKVTHTAEPRNQLQIDFIKFIIENVNKKQNVAGILSPGTGKTFMACYAAIKSGIRTLIVVPTNGIKNQWYDTLVNMFNVSPDKVINITSPKQFINIKADFVIVSQASLAALNRTYNLESIMKKNMFGIKVIDEVQMWFHNIIKVDGSANICHNWYLTGTFGRSSRDENELYQEMFGDLSIFREKNKSPTLFNRKPGNVYGMKPHMNVTMVWTRSRLSKEQIKDVTSSMRYSEREGRWIRYGISVPAYTQLIIPEDGRTTHFLKKILKVIEIANKEVTYGRMLVLTPTIISVEVLAKRIQEMYPKVEVGTIHSRNSRQENDKVKSECDIIVSTVKSSGTGFDVKGLSKLIVTEQFKSWILTDQVSGRLRKRDDGRDTHMWDMVDSDIPQLRAWADVRSSILKKKSKKFTVIDL